MNDQSPIHIPSSVPPVGFIIPVRDDLRERLEEYCRQADLNRTELVERIFDDALRVFLDDHAPIIYPTLCQER